MNCGSVPIRSYVIDVTPLYFCSRGIKFIAGYELVFFLLNISFVRCVKSLMFDNLVRITNTWDFLCELIDEKIKQNINL